MGSLSANAIDAMRIGFRARVPYDVRVFSALAKTSGSWRAGIAWLWFHQEVSHRQAIISKLDASIIAFWSGSREVDFVIYSVLASNAGLLRRASIAGAGIGMKDRGQLCASNVKRGIGRRMRKRENQDLHLKLCSWLSS